MFSPPNCAPFEFNLLSHFIKDDDGSQMQCELIPNEIQLFKSQSMLGNEDENLSPFFRPRNLQRFNSEVFRDFSEVLNVQIGDNNRFIKNKTGSNKKKLYKKIMGDFEIISLIGKGSIGKVFKVKSNVDGLFYATKQVPININIQPLTISGLVQFNGCFQYNDQLFVLMEHCEYSLKQRLTQRVYESEIRQILYDICDVLQQLPKPHFHIHGGNILYSKQMKFKLSDYDFSTTKTHHQAPEGIKGKAADIYSLGLLLMELMLEKEIIQPQYHIQKLDKLSYYSASLKMLIKKMVSTLPEDRPDIKEILKFAKLDHDQELALLVQQNNALQTQINSQNEKRRKSF